MLTVSPKDIPTLQGTIQLEALVPELPLLQDHGQDQYFLDGVESVVMKEQGVLGRDVSQA
jgi:hypothetical protein